MKKGRRIIAVVFFLVTILGVGYSLTYANAFDEDSNYYKYDESNIMAFYVDQKSIDCTRYSPPYYGMKVNIIMWDFMHDEYSVLEHIFLYNYETKKVNMFINRSRSYSPEGNLLYDSYGEDRQISLDVTPGMTGAFLANFIFKKYFGSSFY